MLAAHVHRDRGPETTGKRSGGTPPEPYNVGTVTTCRSPTQVSSEGSDIRIRVLGGITAAAAPAALPIAIGGRQERTILALLAIHRPVALSTERLIDLLWPDAPPPTAAKVVQVQVARLRSALGADAIERIGPGYRLAPAVAIDSDEFEADVRSGLEAVRDDPLVALDLLERALAAALGEPFADVSFVEPIERAAIHLDELRWRAREAYYDLLVRLKRLEPVLSEVPNLVAAEPIRESLWLAWIRALAMSNRRAEALATFEAARSALWKELGVDPQPELVALRDRIERGDRLDHGGACSPFPTRLPGRAGAFFGRAELMGELVDRLRPGGQRVLSLIGPGGTGKTRLAVEVADRLVDRFNGAVAFVDLISVREAEQLWPAVRDAIGLPDRPALIAEGRGLLVLDNPERVAGGAQALAGLIDASPRLQLLIASRIPMRIAGEEVIAVEPLTPPDAIELFESRARAAGGQPEDRDVVESICSRLDRLPLAIELAALQAGAFSGIDLLRALDRRLPTLVGGRHDGPERHRTIEATIGWSYDLLDEADRRLFSRLAVFEGGWTVTAAEAVCDAKHAGLRSLVDHSLVRRTGARMTMLDTIHEYAAARLSESGERAMLLDRHADFYLEEAHRQAAEESDPEFQFRILGEDIPNQRVAMETLCREETTDRAIDFAMTLWMTWLSQGRIAEGDEWFRRATSRPSTTDRPDWPFILAVAGEFPRVSGDLERAEAVKLEAVEIARATGEVGHLAATLSDLGNIAWQRGDAAVSRERHEVAVSIRRQIGDPIGIIHAELGLADLEIEEGNLDVAATLLLDALAFVRREGLVSRASGVFGAEVPIQLARIRLRQGDIDDARALVVEGLEAAHQLRVADDTRSGLEVAAGVLAADGADRTAAMLLGAADGIRRRHGFMDDTWRERRDLEGKVCDRLGEAAYRELADAGAHDSIDDVVALAVDEINGIKEHG